MLFLALQPYAAQAADAFSTGSPWMLGGWGGVRSDLQQNGVSFQAGYTMESASNLAGGYHTSTTARYSDQWAFGVNLDLEKLLNWQDAEFQMTITDRNGQNLSDQIADPRTGMLSSVQEVYGRGQTWRLTQFWLRKGLFGDVLDLKAGRVTVGEDFDNFDSKFQNLAFGSGQAGNWRGDHWYNWPVSQWGGRVRLNITPEVFMQVGFYNQNPYNYDRGDGFRLEFSPTEGNLVPVELGWQPKLGSDKLPGNYRLGYYYSSVNDNVYGSWHNGGFNDTAHAYGGYILAQQQLSAQGGSTDRGITLTLQAVMNDHKTSKTDNYQSIAVTWKGPFDARPQDEIGVGAARIHVNSAYTRMLRQENAFNGETDYNSPTYLPVQEGAEYNYELYYNVQATDWLQIRPNLQYVSAPGAVSEVDDAFIGGISANIVF
ncbi:porin [Klebsiella aerogenes]|uniref:Carbohydrate-selective porin OprB n=1 Tax=Klebsiella aerogenes (strain ATCC 13048 / DSM 30053 / CCUG 1429 / JCM 1235 / KCTC 2190 / NBRC 13534 / NCIMB 10102 / NCTC 10006 / CDC 819-56) TaxID=1028307 RepID=A0A0H3FQG8_KLEAK|nr:carbohydrate porin [Klebsiella aerogenes]AEG96717.1 carbohydrate-selective porin OprB [Klebsiella aerogenes KCTC 2190]MEC4756934.1 carbohydrate porin [Klebsiella aerogenes]QEU20390.1 porin [Klebsiella aerogenes]RFP72560.1 porin [Klebsiella aerogenes]